MTFGYKPSPDDEGHWLIFDDTSGRDVWVSLSHEDAVELVTALNHNEQHGAALTLGEQWMLLSMRKQHRSNALLSDNPVIQMVAANTLWLIDIIDRLRGTSVVESVHGRQEQGKETQEETEAERRAEQRR